MAVITVVEYRHLFDDARPDPREILKSVSSRQVISTMAMINDALSVRGNGIETQAFIMYNLATDFPEQVRSEVLTRAGLKLQHQFEIFNFPYTIEMINREIINFKEKETPDVENASVNTLAIFKAYLAIVEEISERDAAVLHKAVEDAKEGGQNIIRLMWPHLMRQYQFTNRPDPRYEINRSFALLSFLERHPKFGLFAKQYFRSKNCTSYQEYMVPLMSLLLPYMQRLPSPYLIDYFYCIRTTEADPVLESLIADPAAIGANPLKQLDYRGLKEKPLFRFEENEYIVPFWDFFFNSLFTGFIFSFYYTSGIKSEFDDLNNLVDESGFGKFKGMIGKEFSEGILFKNTMKQCFSQKYGTLLFFNDNDSFNPDCYYRQGNNIFIIEFKDYMLSSEIIQSDSYEIIRDEIEKKFVSETTEKNGKTKVKGKGVLQLGRNIEMLANDQALFHMIDEQARVKKLKLRNMTIYPIIVQTSIYFDFPGINDFLDQALQRRLKDMQSKFKHVRPFTMIDFRYFESRILLFSDSRLKLSDELENYQKELKRMRKRANRSTDINDNFDAMTPFSFMYSPSYKKESGYRLSDLREVTEQCWNFKLHA